MWLLDKVSLFTGNNVTTKKFLGKNVIEFSEYFNEDNLKEYYIIIASSYYEEISNQLSQFGLLEEQNYYSIYKKYIDEESRRDKIVNGVKIGKYSYGYKKHCYKGSILKEIGSYCSINESVRIGEVNHPLSYITTHPILYTPKNDVLGYEGVPGFLSKDSVINVYEIETNGDIVIQNDVWIGASAIILPNVTIHNGAVIAAGAVVTKDVPPYAIVGGVPAKVIRYRFSEEEITILQEVKWWEWSEEKIEENLELFKNPQLLFKKYRGCEST
ncbi:antibiotic acetyltransferase [Lysinibacillus fusiformis]